MADTSTPPSKQDVYDALSELKKGRSRGLAYVAIKGILYRYGDGVKHIGDLDPKYYAAVIAAVTIPTTPTAADIYGTVTDVQAAPTEENSSVKSATPPTASTRIRTPLVISLETELAKTRAKTKRSVPNYVVNTGNASRAEDQDNSAVQDFPAGERVS